MVSETLVIEGDVAALASMEVSEAVGQAPIDALELPNVGEEGQAKQPEGFVVALEDEPLGIDDDDARAGGAEDGFVIAFALHGVGFGLEEDAEHAIERLVEEGVVGRLVAGGEVEGEIVVVDGVEHEGDLAEVVPVEGEDPHSGDEACNGPEGTDKPLSAGQQCTGGGRQSDEDGEAESEVVG